MNLFTRLSRAPLVLAIGTLLAQAAAAEVTPYRFSLTPHAGYVLGGQFEDDDTGDEVDLDEAAGLGLILNAPFDDRTEWEVFYSRQETDIDDTTVAIDPGLDITIHYLQIGGTYVGEGRTARPYMVATIGGSHIDPDSSDFDSDTFFAFGIGGGLQVFPASRVGLRLEGRLFGSFIDSDTALFCRSGPAGSQCLIRTEGDMLWQWDMFAGVTVRF
jgi:opacity protein-like surface antigen